jgi:hypothetical protein
MSEIKVNKISPKQTCTQLTLGDSGDTIIIPAGATITNNGTATGFGRTGTVDWDTTPKTTTVTAASGVGYFVDTTSGAITVNLPAGVAGSIVAVSDYANISATNNIVITPNGTNKIDGVNASYYLATNGAAITLIYVDSTRGWKDIYDSTLNAVGVVPTFITATGGTITTSGDYKIHTFTGPGTFTVCSVGNPQGSTTVDYMVVAGGGAGGFGVTSYQSGGGGGAGGYRESSGTASGSYTVSPLGSGVSALPVSVTGYPITVGAGGATTTQPADVKNPGSPSVFSTITSTGGGGGGIYPANNGNGNNGGSGGGGGSRNTPCGSGAQAGTGNSPPVAPAQGTNGGNGNIITFGPGNPHNGGGGGGATVAGTAATGPQAGPGGTGATSSINTTPTARAGGGGGGSQLGLAGTASGGGGAGGANNAAGSAGTVNTGGGGGGGANNGCGERNGGAGGSGIVVIRYKFQ